MRHGVSDACYHQELHRLKQKISVLEKGVKRLCDRVNRMDVTSPAKLHAVVDASKCTACGLCEHVCPVVAVRITYIARVNTERCTGCGVCVENCPLKAIKLRA